MRSFPRLDGPVTETTLAGALIMLLVGFRTFGTDHYQYLLHARRAADPTFAVGDWFVEQTESYHYTFSFLAGHALAIDRLEAFLLAWATVTAFALAAGVVWLVRAAGGDRAAVAIAVVTALAVSHVQGWGNLALLDGQALPHYLGTALALVVLAAVIARRPMAVAIALTATTLVHVNVGIWVGLLAAVAITVDLHRWRELRWRPALAVLCVGSLPMLAVVAGDFATGAAPPEAFRALLYGRSPHHYLPLSLPRESQLTMGVLLGATITLAVTVGAERRRLTAVMATAWTSLALGVVASTVVLLPPVVRLFPFRLTPILTTLVIAVLAARATRRDRGAMVAALALLALVTTSVSVLTACAIAAVAVAAAVMWALRDRRNAMEPDDPVNDPGRHAGPTARRGPLAAALLVAVTVVALIGVDRTFRPTHPGFSPAIPAGSKLAAELGTATESGDIILTDPGIAGLRWYSGRAIVVDYKVFPLTGEGMGAWRERMLAVTSIDPALADEWSDGRHLARAYSDGYQRQTLAHLQASAETYGATAILLSSAMPAAAEAEAAGLRMVPMPDDLVLVWTGSDT